MSAIAAILRFDGAPVAEGEIERLIGAMRSRGPDGTTIWREGSVALGHAMLHATPESLEEVQPLTAADGRYRMIWDGRLDNREELKHELALHRILPRNETDPELVLQTFLIHRDRTPARLLGDFAFVIWDTCQRELFCARDQIGARPMFYVQTKDYFAMASDTDPLLALDGMSRRVSPDHIATYFVGYFDEWDDGQSWFSDVKILPPAHSLRVTSDGQGHLWRYWSFPVRPEARFSSDAECYEAFHAVFGAAVRARMRALGTPAVMLSGGLDSTAVVATMRRVAQPPPGHSIASFSVISDSAEHCVESQSIATLVRSFVDTPHFVTVPSFTGELSFADLEAVEQGLTHPADYSILLPALMCMAAGQRGHKVMLYGAMGDLATYTPNRYPAWFLRSGRLIEAWSECMAASKNNTYLAGIRPAKLLALSAYSAFAPRWMRLGVSHVRRVRLAPSAREIILRPEFLAQVKLSERVARWRAVEFRSEIAKNVDMHCKVVESPDVASGLGAADRVGARYGVETRDPWADRTVLDFMVHLPARMKVHDGWTKYIVRKGFASLVDHVVLDRKGKEHLGYLCHTRLLEKNRHKYVEELADHAAPVRTYVDSQGLTAMLSAFRQGQPHANLGPIYRVAALNRWLHHASSTLVPR
jgi:asparagine synthase (glutamine-hydrolysing)